MKDIEKAIVMAHTGVCMLAGDKLHIFYEYIQELLGRPVYTHELAFLADTIKEESTYDFIMLCERSE